MNARPVLIVVAVVAAGYLAYRGGRALTNAGEPVRDAVAGAVNAARAGATNVGQSIGGAVFGAAQRLRELVGARDEIAARADAAGEAADRAEAELAARQRSVGVAPPVFGPTRTYQAPAKVVPGIRKSWEDMLKP